MKDTDQRAEPKPQCSEPGCWIEQGHAGGHMYGKQRGWRTDDKRRSPVGSNAMPTDSADEQRCGECGAVMVDTSATSVPADWTFPNCPDAGYVAAVLRDFALAIEQGREGLLERGVKALGVLRLKAAAEPARTSGEQLQCDDCGWSGLRTKARHERKGGYVPTRLVFACPECKSNNLTGAAARSSRSHTGGQPGREALEPTLPGKASPGSEPGPVNHHWSPFTTRDGSHADECSQCNAPKSLHPPGPSVNPSDEDAEWIAGPVADYFDGKTDIPAEELIETAARLRRFSERVRCADEAIGYLRRLDAAWWADPEPRADAIEKVLQLAHHLIKDKP